MVGRIIGEDTLIKQLRELLLIGVKTIVHVDLWVDSGVACEIIKRYMIVQWCEQISIDIPEDLIIRHGSIHVFAPCVDLSEIHLLDLQLFTCHCFLTHYELMFLIFDGCFVKNIDHEAHLLDIHFA